MKFDQNTKTDKVKVRPIIQIKWKTGDKGTGMEALEEVEPVAGQAFSEIKTGEEREI